MISNNLYDIPFALVPLTYGSESENICEVKTINTTNIYINSIALINNIFTGIIDPISSTQASNKNYIDKLPINVTYLNFPEFSWTTYSNASNISINWGNITYGINFFICSSIGCPFYMQYSNDGINWTYNLLSPNTSSGKTYFYNNTFYAIEYITGNNSILWKMTYTTFISWTTIYSFNNEILDITYLYNTNIINPILPSSDLILYPNTLLNKTNNINYTPSINICTITPWNTIIDPLNNIYSYYSKSASYYSYNQLINNSFPYFITLSENIIYRSIDLISWSTISLTTPAKWNSMIYSPELQLLLIIPLSTESNNKINIYNGSYDGINYFEINTFTSAYWNNITWAPELPLFLINTVNENGLIAISKDGINWTSSIQNYIGYDFTTIWSNELMMFISKMNNNIINNIYDVSSDGIIWTSKNNIEYNGQNVLSIIKNNTQSFYNNIFMLMANNYIGLIIGIPSSINYSAQQIINGGIYRNIINATTDNFPSGQNIILYLQERLKNIEIPSFYSFETIIINNSIDQNGTLILNLNQPGLYVNASKYPIINPGSFCTLLISIINNSLVNIFYSIDINIFNISLTSDYMRFQNGLILNNNTVDSNVIYNITNTNSIIYTKEYFTNNIIIRTNTPVSDSLPSSSDLYFSSIQNNDTYICTIMNIGSGILTIYKNDIGIQNSNAAGIFLTLPSMMSTVIAIVYNSLSNIFIAYEISRGLI